jgi:hypothetical protein
MPKETGYLITVRDDASDVYKFGVVPPYRIFRSLEDAKHAIREMGVKLLNFKPVLYGEAYPYENKTFEVALAEQHWALYGWGEMDDDDGEKVGLYVIQVEIA